MNNWHMLTLIGEDRPGIVAAVTQALYKDNMSLGETSMLRLGGNFTIMMMVASNLTDDQIAEHLQPMAQGLGLSLHVEPLRGGLHRHIAPNLVVRVSGADRAGIVAQVTGILADHGFNILDLGSDVVGSQRSPVYIMQIAGVCDAPLEELEEALNDLRKDGIDVNVSPLELLVG